MSDRDASQLAQAPQTQKPIRELPIRQVRFPDGGYADMTVRIDDSRQLVLEGADAGKFVGDVWGVEEYEFSETVAASWKETVLLHLMAERFDKTSDFRKWCQERGIPTKFWSWP